MPTYLFEIMAETTLLELGKQSVLSVSFLSLKTHVNHFCYFYSLSRDDLQCIGWSGERCSGFGFFFFFFSIKEGQQFRRKPVPFQKVVVVVSKIIMKGE